MAYEGTCSIPDCPNTRIVARGYCQNHYHRWRIHGDPLAGRILRNHEARFLSKVEKGPGEDGCWIFCGQRNEDGYGLFWSGGTREAGGRTELAHRWSYAWFVGPIPDGSYVLHHCDTPACVRPDHIYAGTQLDNMRDRQRRGRFDNGRVKLTIEQVQEIRRRYRGSAGEQAALAAEFGVSPCHISSILHGRVWRAAT